MITEKFLRNRRNQLTREEHAMLDAAVSEVRPLDARFTLVKEGDTLEQSTLLIEGFMCRYKDDRRGYRQLVAVHVPGDFVDLHGFPLKTLDHDVATLTAATVALVPHDALDAIVTDHPQLGRKFWYATMLDAAMHRGWLFRLGRLDAVGRVAHFLCETSARLAAVGLSDGRQFTVGITQADLAEACGVTSIHINRVFRQLREEGLCLFRSGMVELLDSKAMARRGQFNPQYLYLADPQVGEGTAE